MPTLTIRRSSADTPPERRHPAYVEGRSGRMYDTRELEPPVEVTSRRRPPDVRLSCLLRLAADGTVFAVNDGALALLGVKSAARALGHSFTAWLPPDEHERWRAFCAGVLTGASVSIECDMNAPSGDRQPVLFHGVLLAEDPDGRPSMAVAARAVSAQRQLEAAIVELEMQLRERDKEWAQARVRLAEAATRARPRPGLERLRVPGTDAVDAHDAVANLETGAGSRPALGHLDDHVVVTASVPAEHLFAHLQGPKHVQQSNHRRGGDDGPPDRPGAGLGRGHALSPAQHVTRPSDSPGRPSNATR